MINFYHKKNKISDYLPYVPFNITVKKLAIYLLILLLSDSLINCIQEIRMKFENDFRRI